MARKKVDDASDNASAINPTTGRTRTSMDNAQTFDRRGSFSVPSAEQWGADSMSNPTHAPAPRPRGPKGDESAA